MTNLHIEQLERHIDGVIRRIERLEERLEERIEALETPEPVSMTMYMVDARPPEFNQYRIVELERLVADLIRWKNDQ